VLLNPPNCHVPYAVLCTTQGVKYSAITNNNSRC
jgi:hypothetical protein